MVRLTARADAAAFAAHAGCARQQVFHRAPFGGGKHSGLIANRGLPSMFMALLTPGICQTVVERTAGSKGTPPAINPAQFKARSAPG